MRIRIPGTNQQIARWPFHHAEIDVDLIGRARNGASLDTHRLEETQSIQAYSGALDRFVGYPATLHLPHLPAQHFITRLGVSLETDAPHVYVIAGVDEECQVDFTFGVVDFRHCVDVGERVAFVAEPIADASRRLRDQLAGKFRVLNDGDEIEEFLFGHDESALKVYVTNEVAATFGDVDGDVDVLLVGRDRYLSRVDVEVDESVVEIEGTQCFEIGCKLRFGISIRARDEGEEPRRVELEIIQQFIIVERDIPYDVDLPNLRDVAFRDLELDSDTVAFEGCHRTGDLRAVPACREIRTMQFLFHLIECRAVEDAPLGESHLLEARQEVLRLEFFIADEFDAAYGRPLDHRHDECVAIAFKTHVTEETGLEQRTEGAGSARAGDRISDLDREVVENGAGGDSLESFQANVLDDERVGRRANPHCGKNPERSEKNA